MLSEALVPKSTSSELYKLPCKGTKNTVQNHIMLNPLPRGGSYIGCNRNTFNGVNYIDTHPFIGEV